MSRHVPAVQHNGRWLPIQRELDGVTFYLAFDAKGVPFYTDVEPK